MDIKNKQLLMLKAHFLTKEIGLEFDTNTKYSYEELEKYIRILEIAILNDIRRKQDSLKKLLHTYYINTSTI